MFNRSAVSVRREHMKAQGGETALVQCPNCGVLRKPEQILGSYCVTFRPLTPGDLGHGGPPDRGRTYRRTERQPGAGREEPAEP
jgi:hypothetical protein